jgi:hypothetical protein
MAAELTVEPPVRGLLKSDIREGERILRWFKPVEPLLPFVHRIWSAEWKISARREPYTADLAVPFREHRHRRGTGYGHWGGDPRSRSTP